MGIHVVLLWVGLIMFLLSAFKVKSEINFIAFGLAAWIATFLV